MDQANRPVGRREVASGLSAALRGNNATEGAYILRMGTSWLIISELQNSPRGTQQKTQIAGVFMLAVNNDTGDQAVKGALPWLLTASQHDW